LLPIRNPLHVAYSFYIHDGFRETFYKPLDPNQFVPFLNDILLRFATTINVGVHNPNQVMWFFEHEIGTGLLNRLSTFLKVSPDSRWLKDAEKCFGLEQPDYRFSGDTLEYYKKRVAKLFTNLPEVQAQFLNFLQPISLRGL
jgi:hypothetical protein